MKDWIWHTDGDFDRTCLEGRIFNLEGSERLMPIIHKKSEKLKPGTVIREKRRVGEIVLVVDTVEKHPDGMWAHKMRAPTEEEQALSDVLQT